MKKVVMLVGVLGFLTIGSQAQISLSEQMDMEHARAVISNEEMQKAALEARADRAAQQATAQLEALLQNASVQDKGYIENAIEWNKKFVEIFKNEKHTRLNWFCQKHINDLEIFASFIRGWDNVQQREEVKVILNHEYYFPDYEENRLVLLKEAALGLSRMSVNLHNGNKTAGLDDDDTAFYQGLKEKAAQPQPRRRTSENRPGAI